MIQFEGENIAKDRLPKPVGWRVLVGMLKIDEKTAGGIILTDEHRKGREYLRSMAKVLAVGDGCYQHPKFQGGVSIEQHVPEPWVKEGDVVLINQYSGQSISCNGDDGEQQSLRIFNDDEILAVIPDVNVLSH